MDCQVTHFAAPLADGLKALQRCDSRLNLAMKVNCLGA